MHHWLRVAALPVLLALGGAAAAPDRTVSYTLAPAVEGGAIMALDVTIRLRANPSGTTTLDWLDSWAGEARLGQWARDISVEGATSSTPAPNGGRIVRSAPGAALVMHYRIVSAYAADPTADDSEQTRPVVRPGWFYSIGEILYARPVGRQDAPANFTWAGPANIGFASDTEHATGADGHGRSVADILESITIGGRDLSVSAITLNGAPVRVARIGSFAFDTKAFDALAGQVVAAERDFWRDTQGGPVLITAISLARDSRVINYNGTGRGADAFATWVDHDAPMRGLAWLLAHEYFHSWNAVQLGGLPARNETEAYWMSEGFTDFYARRLMLRAGLWTPSEFVTDWNEMLRAYAVSPFRATPNAEAAAKFWSGDYPAEQIAYQRGALLALLWDRQLQAKGTGDLDTVLRAQRDRTLMAKVRPPLIEAFVAEIARTGLDIRPDIDRYLTRGERIFLPGFAFGACTRLITVNTPVFELGWDADATAKAGDVLTGVDPASNAYAAGLRDGMKILRRGAGELGNSAVNYVVEIKRPDGSAIYSFLPAGKQIRPGYQKVVLDPARFAAEPEKCKAALAG